MTLIIFFILGLLTSLLFPPYFFLPLGFVIFPLICLLINKQRKNFNKLNLFLNSFVFGTAFFLSLLIWLKNPFLVLYRENFQVELIVSPNHEPNRIPYGEKDFPLAVEQKPLIENQIKDEIEAGIRFQTSLVGSDISFSYFMGNDRMPSVHSVFSPKDPTVNSKFNLGYRKTTVFGSDFVTFIGDLTIRAEGALYNTKSGSTDDEILSDNYFALNQDVTYSQYVIQLEYTTAADIMISGQFIGSSTIDETNQWFSPKKPSYKIDFIPILPFSPGMGTPLAMFTNKAALISSSGVMMDDQLELSGSLMINLNESGSMLSATIGYSPILNWKFELATTQFQGNADQLNPFTLMQDFNHVRMGIMYNF